MTNTTAPEGYERIEWAVVREGDVLFHENGDRLTVTERDSGVRVLVAGTEIGRMDVVWARHGFTPYRKVEPLPDVDGIYISAEHAASRWSDTYPIYSFKSAVGWATDGSGRWIDVPENEVPRDLVRLVPMPTEEQVSTAMCSALRHTGDRECEYDHEAAAAVMALLAGEGGE